VQYDEFIDLVAREAGVHREQGVPAPRATLKTLAQRITHGEAEDKEIHEALSQLPKDIQDLVGQEAQWRS
jgi:uncharacterized protein (DUF2267 family)